MKIWIYALCLGLCADVAQGAATADDPRNQGAEQASSDKDTRELPSVTLEKVTVSATRTERAVFTTPSAVTSLSRDEILQALPYGYQDLFKDVPGTLMVGGPRRIAEEPSIRGFQDEQVVIRVDGARQNFNQAHRGRFFTDPSLLKRVEVLRGSTSAVYGSGALGGVISLTTMDPDDYLGNNDGLGARLGASYQTNGSELGLYGTAYAQSGAFDILASYGWRELDEDLEDGDGASIAGTQDAINNGLVKLGLDLSPTQRLEFSATMFENEGRNPPNANAPATATNLVDRDTDYDSYRLSYDFEPSANPFLDLHATLYRNEVQVKEFRLDDGRRDQSTFRTEGLDIYNTSRFDFIADRDWRLTYGVEAYTDEQAGLRNGQPRTEFPDAQADYRAFYVQAELPLTDRLELIPGIRYDQFEYQTANGFPGRDEDALNPKLSLGFQATHDIYLWGGVAAAFRAPSLTELYATGVHFVAPIGPGQVVINEFVPTPELKPEEARTIELGLRRRHGNVDQGSVFSATAYHSEVDNYVEQFVVFISGPPEFDPRTQTLIFPGFTSNRNVDAELQGVEVSWDWWHGPWSGAIIGTLLDGENTDSGEGLGFLAQDNVVLKASRWFANHSMRLGGRLTAAMDADDAPEGELATDAWQTVDLFYGWTPSSGWLEGFELRAGIDNVLDETYRVHPNGINAIGRTFKLSIARQLGF